ncbi:MAG: MFS transporter, partial [Rhodobacteraceae bacterium]|nr:MFS transporter [Paracoccaceae bacterium]
MSQSKRIWGWFFYDWACQPFYTLMLTFFFAPYFATVAADYFVASGMEIEASKAKAQTMWSICLSASGLFIGISAPILGAIADTSGRRMTTLGNQNEIGKISGSGFGFGYLGGVFALAIALLFLVEQPNGTTFMLGIEPLFGFLNPENMEGTRFVGPLAAVWFIVFAIPYFKNMKDDPALLNKINVGKGLKDLFQLLKSLKARKSLSAYLVSSMFYRDAMNGLYSFGGVYAALVLDWTITQLGIFGIIAALGAALFSWLGGKADSLLGPKPVITFCIYIMIIVCITIVGMTPNSLFGIQ